MAQNKIQITAENSREWLASTGFIFPINQVELTRYNLLFGDADSGITGKEVDPFKIIKDSSRNVRYIGVKQYIKGLHQHKMVAANANTLPAHIMKLVNKSGNSQTGKKPN